MMNNKVPQEKILPGSQYGRERDFWLRTFSGNLIKSHFPYDFRQPLDVGHSMESASFRIEDELFSRLIQLIKGYDNRLHVILTSGLVVLMHRYTGNRDIIVGSPIYKQDVEGDFINTVLALRNQLQEDMTVKDLLVVVRQNLRQATENQNYPIQTLLYQLDLPFRENEFPLFDLVILLENIHKKEYIEHISHNVSFSFSRKETFIAGKVEYRSSLYRRQTIEQIIDHFICLLGRLVSNLDAEIFKIEILSEQDRKQLIWEFNDTRTEYPLDKTIDMLLADQARLKQDAIAVVYENEALTYKELDEKSHGLAAFLSKRGVSTEMPVGVMTERSLEAIIGIVAILKAGGCYVPIDPDYPEERKHYIIDDCNITLLCTNCKTGAPYNCEIIDLEDPGRFPVLVPTDNEKCRCSDELAYIIYTSGSTGKPKGGMIEHRNVVRLVKHTNFVDFDEKDRILQTGALEFDASTFEIWGALLNGLQLYLVSKDKVILPDPLKDSIRKYEITTMWLTSPLFNQLVDADTEIFHGLRNLLVGGDTLSPPHINRVRQTYPALNIINGYGPTENTTFSTTYLIDKRFKENIPIGKPIANSTAYIFDTQMRLVPLGVSGELYVGGDGVARGYLNSPEITNTRFIVNRLGPGERLYITGDRARWLPGGNIEFLGRIDFQVKIRGYRVEPGEIENYLKDIKSIRDVLVTGRTSKDREIYLCAYVISHRHQPLDWQEIKKSLSGRLPDYMIPSYFVQMEEFPLTVNKKVDISALPEPEMEAGTDYVPPGNEIEVKLVEIWSEVLKIEKEVIGINADFFDLGGHSLKATTLAADLHKELGVKVALAEIFKTPTIKELAEYINGLGESKYSEIESVEEREYHNISSAQKRLFFLQKMDTNQTHYNIPVAILLQGKLNLQRLEENLKILIGRHEILRTSFEMIDGEAVQRIAPIVNFKVDYYSSVKEAGLGIVGTNSIISEDFIIKGFIRAFDLSRTPLIRATVIKRGQHSYLLLVDMHHIITDGTSMGIFVQEFMKLYNGKKLSPLRIQYKEFSLWQNNLIKSGEMKNQAEYWQRQFDGDIPVLNLPIDYSRPALQSFEGNMITFDLDQEQYLALKEIAKHEKTTLFIVLFAVYNIFISRLTLQEDIVVGIPTAGRRHASLKPIIGMFVNMLAIRNFPCREKTASGFLKDLNSSTLKAFENQDYQFEELVDQLELKRDTSRNPFFDTAFVLQNFEIPEIEIPGLKLTPYKFENTTSKFDLTMHGYESGSKLSFSLTYSTRLFKKESIKRFENYFKTLISSVIADPGEKIANLEFIPQHEKKRILHDFNDTKAGYPMDKTIHQLFVRQVEKTPANEAVVFIDAHTRRRTALTYKELDEKTNRLASVLRRKGVKAGTIAAVLLERSLEMVTALLAILKAGGAYLPIEPDTPVKRIATMLEDSRPVIVLTGSAIVEKDSFAALQGLGEAAAQVLIPIPGIALVPAEAESEIASKPKGGREILMLDALDEALAAESGDNPGCINTSADLAYIIYTSGSTGKPKGSLIQHKNVVRLMVNDRFLFDFNSSDVWTMFHSYCFDFSVWEMYGALLYGGKLVVIPKTVSRDPGEYFDIIESEEVTVLNQTPSAFYNLSAEALNRPAVDLKVRYVIFGGEALKPGKLSGWRSRYPETTLVNMYGITETTVHVTFKEIGDAEIESNISNIGKPIPTLRVYVLDNHLKPVPIGVGGELFVGGDGVCLGYLNRPELTAEKFGHALWDLPDITGKLYKSGDLVKWTESGDMEYMGRIDQQVKIRGFRIEPAEIERYLSNHRDITEALVVPGEAVIKGETGENRDKYLCAYILSDQSFEVSELRQYLSLEFPDYMIPSYFIMVDKIPLTANGKVDIKQLPTPWGAKAAAGYTAARDEIEEKLVEMWAEVLNLKPEVIGIDSNFFELGGHSLNSVFMTSRIQGELNVKLPLAEIFKTPTIRELSGFIKGLTGQKFVPLEPAEEKEYYQLSSAQKRLYILNQMDDQGIGYNIPTTVIWDGKIDKRKLEHTFISLINRHESLRTSFHMIEDEPVQRINKHHDVDFKIEYYEAMEEKPEQEPRHSSFIVNHLLLRPFDLSLAPLLRVALIKVTGERHILAVDMHHIISDGISMEIFIRESASLYTGKELPALKLQYKDYAEWYWSPEYRQTLKQLEKYWLTLFETVPPQLELPIDFPRQSVQSIEGKSLEFTLDKARTRLIKNIARDEDVTLFMVLLAIYNVFLARLSGQDDIAVGITTFGRSRPDLENIIGVFINTLACRNQTNPEQDFIQFLGKVKRNTIKAFENQDYPFEKLVEKALKSRDAHRNSLFDVSFKMDRFDFSPGDFGELNLKPYPQELSLSKFDLTLSAGEAGETLKFRLEYRASLFTESTIESFAGYFQEIILALVENPGIKLGDIEIPLDLSIEKLDMQMDQIDIGF